MESPQLRLALAQVPPHTGSTSEALSRLESLAQQAVQQQADLLVLPEMFLTGYALGQAEVAARAEDRDGPAAQETARIAGQHGLGIVYGYPERDADGSVYNSANFIDDSGERLLTYRKVHLFGDLDGEQFQESSQISEVVHWRGWGIALAVCYDVEFPETTRILAEAGADLVCAPTANMVEYDHVQEVLLPARALESQLYLAYANYCGADRLFTYGGKSLVAGPDGIGPRATGHSDQLLIAELDYELLQESRRNYPYLRDRQLGVPTPGQTS